MVPVLMWFLLLLVFGLFFKCLPIKQTYTETLTLDLIMELLYYLSFRVFGSLFNQSDL